MPEYEAIIGENRRYSYDIHYLYEFFLLPFPRSIINLVIDATNENMKAQGRDDITYGEFLLCVSLQFFMCFIEGFLLKGYFSSSPITFSQGDPYRLNSFMSKRRFQATLHNLVFTTEVAPTFVDKFWEIRTIVKLWNDNMASIFSPGHIICLDESMSIWHNKWSCPG